MTTAEFLWKILPNLLVGLPGQRPGGLILSILISLGAVAIGFPIALIVGSAGASSRWLLRRLADIYVACFRGLPLLLLLLLIHQGLGGRSFGLTFSPIQSTMIALTLYVSAYQAEVVRAGLLAVPRELMESARVLGAGTLETFLRVRLRYTLQTMLPGFVNETITLFKDSSVVMVLGVGDLMMVARAQLGSTIRNSIYWVPTYILVGILYALVAFGLSRLAVYWERRYTPPQMRA